MTATIVRSNGKELVVQVSDITAIHANMHDDLDVYLKGRAKPIRAINVYFFEQSDFKGC